MTHNAAENKEEWVRLAVMTFLAARIEDRKDGYDSLKSCDTTTFIAYIYLLEQIGHIQSDEYNGCVFAFAKPSH